MLNIIFEFMPLFLVRLLAKKCEKFKLGVYTVRKVRPSVFILD